MGGEVIGVQTSGPSMGGCVRLARAMGKEVKTKVDGE